MSHTGTSSHQEEGAHTGDPPQQGELAPSRSASQRLHWRSPPQRYDFTDSKRADCSRQEFVVNWEFQGHDNENYWDFRVVAQACRGGDVHAFEYLCNVLTFAFKTGAMDFMINLTTEQLPGDRKWGNYGVSQVELLAAVVTPINDRAHEYKIKYRVWLEHGKFITHVQCFQGHPIKDYDIKNELSTTWLQNVLHRLLPFAAKKPKGSASGKEEEVGKLSEKGETGTSAKDAQMDASRDKAEISKSAKTVEMGTSGTKDETDAPGETGTSSKKEDTGTSGTTDQPGTSEKKGKKSGRRKKNN